MNPTVILDTDFLSAFLKIDYLALVRQLYRVEQLHIPPAVHREIAVSELLPQLLAHKWIAIESPTPQRIEGLLDDGDFRRLGPGEQEAVALALQVENAVLLINDNQARRWATQKDINAVNIPAFLLACKMTGLLERKSITAIVEALREKDFYQFREDVLNQLIA